MMEAFKGELLWKIHIYMVFEHVCGSVYTTIRVKSTLSSFFNPHKS